MAFILVLLGFATLLAAAGWLVDGASGLARRAGVSEWLVGLTICAFGTSAPELVVNVSAAARGEAAVVFGNVLGSNIFNTLGVLGIGAVLAPLVVPRSAIVRDAPIGVAAAAVLWVGAQDGVVGWMDGLLLLWGFVLFLASAFADEAPEIDTEDPGSLTGAAVRVGAGAIGLPVGAQLAVDNTLVLGHGLGLSEAFLGLTVVALGTSLPELATTAVAAWKGRAELAVGNVVGSNAFNLLLVVGVSAVVRPLHLDAAFALDTGIFVGATALVLGMASMRRPLGLARPAGVLLLVALSGYGVLLGLREGGLL